MDLSTEYLGFRLQNPIVVGASPLTNDPEMVRQLEDAGASAFVLHSLFEEEIESEVVAAETLHDRHERYGEPLSYLPQRSVPTTIERYLELIERVKETVSVPVIGSINGNTPGGWTAYAAAIEGAGADALELNIYNVPTNVRESSEDVEERYLEIVREVRRHVSFPLAVKVSPFFSSFAHFAHQLDKIGVNGLVLFNRFYQPDLNIENLSVVPNLHLSAPEELRLRLRWLAILSGRVESSLAATGGIHSAREVLKAIMAGAHATQIVSAILRHGPERVREILEGIENWMETQEYGSLSEIQGTLGRMRYSNPEAFEHANYIRVLRSWR